MLAVGLPVQMGKIYQFTYNAQINNSSTNNDNLEFRYYDAYNPNTTLKIVDRINKTAGRSDRTVIIVTSAPPDGLRVAIQQSHRHQ